MIRRNFLVELEVRSEEGASPVIGGYAAKFDSLSLDLGGFKEKIERGAFTKTLADESNDIVALWSHDWSQPIGRRSAQTLTLTEDESGLRVEIKPDNTRWSQDALESVRSGNVRGMSFGFMVNAEQWDYNAKIRTLTEVSLYEVSLVVMPAYPETEAAVRTILTELEDSYQKHEPKPTKVSEVAKRKYQLLSLKK